MTRGVRPPLFVGRINLVGLESDKGDRWTGAGIFNERRRFGRWIGIGALSAGEAHRSRIAFSTLAMNARRVPSVDLSRL